MIELPFVPSTVKGEKPTMKGVITVMAPPYPKRLKYQAKFAGMATDASQDTTKSESEKRSEQMLLISELVEECAQYIKAVDLQLIDGSVKAQTVEELFGYGEFESVVIEIAMGMIQGFAGNSQRL